MCAYWHECMCESLRVCIPSAIVHKLLMLKKDTNTRIFVHVLDEYLVFPWSLYLSLIQSVPPIFATCSQERTSETIIKNAKESYSPLVWWSFHGPCFSKKYKRGVQHFELMTWSKIYTRIINQQNMSRCCTIQIKNLSIFPFICISLEPIIYFLHYLGSGTK